MVRGSVVHIFYQTVMVSIISHPDSARITFLILTIFAHLRVKVKDKKVKYFSYLFPLGGLMVSRWVRLGV